MVIQQLNRIREQAKERATEIRQNLQSDPKRSDRTELESEHNALQAILFHLKHINEMTTIGMIENRITRSRMARQNDYLELFRLYYRQVNNHQPENGSL